MTPAPARPTPADVEAARALLVEADRSWALHWESCRKLDRLWCKACQQLDEEAFQAQALYYATKLAAGVHWDEQRPEKEVSQSASLAGDTASAGRAIVGTSGDGPRPSTA